MSVSDYICDYCNRSFTRKYNLQTHIEYCHLNSSCFCDICNQKFGSPAGLQLHLSRGHNRFGQGFPECDVCGRVFTRKQNITSHMITVHIQGGRSVVECNLCYKTFTTERNLKRHINQLHNPDIQYPTCNDCHKVFKGKHSLIAHIQSTHNSSEKGLLKCGLCDKSYTNNRNLKRHTEMLHGDKGEFKCMACPKVYTSNQSLRRHTRAQHATIGQYNCQYCSKLIIGKENLDAHISFYHEHKDSKANDYNLLVPSEFTCNSCRMNFEEEYMLRQHIKVMHNFQDFYDYCKKSLLKSAHNVRTRKQNTMYHCEFCNNIFGTVYELKDHMRSSHDKEYSLATCNVCFTKFFNKESIIEHKKTCLPPDNVNSCNYCDKLFTDISSLDFHMRIFHPQAHIADSNISSNSIGDPTNLRPYKCAHCDRLYYNDRSLKHHIKLKHTSDETVECQFCGKQCSNKYYLASHIKLVHNNDSWSKCDYCDKLFKSKRNIRRHIEYTHLGKQRYKCIECETLFKEKRSLRKHVRIKHPNSKAFPQCHICQKRFESAKSCKIHLKLLHSFNMNTHPCDLCSVSFDSIQALNIHLSTNHSAEDVIYKCEECNLVFRGYDKFENHSEQFHCQSLLKEKALPRCIICMKDFSTRKTLKRHIKKFHNEFNVDELATYGSRKRDFNVDCGDCVKRFNDDFYVSIFQRLKHLSDSIIFKCDTCKCSYNCLEYSIQRYKLNYDVSKSKLYLSELCTTQMSDDSRVDSNDLDPESMTDDIKLEPPDDVLSDYDIKTEPQSP